MLSDRSTFAETIVKLHDTFDPVTIVEPSCVTIPWGLKRAAEYLEAKTDMVIVHAHWWMLQELICLLVRLKDSWKLRSEKRIFVLSIRLIQCV